MTNCIRYKSKNKVLWFFYTFLPYKKKEKKYNILNKVCFGNTAKHHLHLCASFIKILDQPPYMHKQINISLSESGAVGSVE